MEFLTTEEKTVVGGSYVDIPVEAKNAGEEGNVEAGKVTYLPQELPNVTITNSNAIAGGTEEEDDESLRKRIVLRWYGVAYGGCEESFRSMALEVTGVAEALAVACYLGPGTVKILIWSKNEAGSLVPASDTLVDAVQDYLDERKPICTKVLVAQPTGVLQDVFVYLEVDSGYTFAVISESVKAAIMDFFDDLDVGDDLIVSKLLAAIMAVMGVKDAKIGKPKDNVSCSVLEKIMLGRVAITTRAWESQYVTW